MCVWEGEGEGWAGDRGFETRDPRKHEENKSQARQGWASRRIRDLSLSKTEIELLPLCRCK